jgi:hypothetical protein
MLTMKLVLQESQLLLEAVQDLGKRNETVPGFLDVSWPAVGDWLKLRGVEGREGESCRLRCLPSNMFKFNKLLAELSVRVTYWALSFLKRHHKP